MSNVQTLNAVSSAQMGQFVTIFSGLKMLSQNFGAAEHCVRLTKLLGALMAQYFESERRGYLLKIKYAQHSVQRIAFGAFSAGVLVGGIVMLAIVYFYFGVR